MRRLTTRGYTQKFGVEILIPDEAVKLECGNDPCHVQLGTGERVQARSVARSVIDQLPHESVLYVGDTARQPYGPKPIGEVREYALECLDHLVDEGVKALVIACNSASAARRAASSVTLRKITSLIAALPPQ